MISDVCTLLIVCLMPLTSYGAYIHPPYMPIKYMALIFSLGYVLVFGTYLATTCKINITVGCVLAYIYKVVRSICPFSHNGHVIFICSIIAIFFSDMLNVYSVTGQIKNMLWTATHFVNKIYHKGRWLSKASLMPTLATGSYYAPAIQLESLLAFCSAEQNFYIT